MKLSDYKNSGFNHANFRTSYDNDEEENISSQFLVPALKHCIEFNRLTYSFSSSALKGWAGAFSNIISDKVKIRIICDMSWIINSADNQLRIAFENKLDDKRRQKIIMQEQYKLLLAAFEFDNDSENVHKRMQLLDWLIATEQLEVSFAYPKDLKPIDEHSPLAHKKIGYFVFPDNSICGFRGSWNETDSGSARNDEDVSVFSGNIEAAQPWLNDIVTAVNKYQKKDSKKFDFIGINKEIIQKIKFRAPKQKPVINQNLLTEPNTLEPEFNEKHLFDYQKDVLDDWEKKGRKGLVKHATGSGKTFTSIFALKRHLEDNSIGLVIVPSTLLLEQWQKEIPKIIPELRDNMLLVDGLHKNWRKRLSLLSKPRSGKKQLIIAVVNSASSDDFLERLHQGSHLMIVADEVHTLGSETFSKVLQIESGARLGVSATPERFNDPEGTNRIFNYFGGLLEPQFPIEKAIGKSLVPYEYHPETCHLNEVELENWENLSEEIRLLIAKSPRNENNEMIPTKKLQLKLIERSRIAKRAHSKISAANNIIKKYYQSGDRWLVYCDSIIQIEEIQNELRSINIYASIYHSMMPKISRERNLEKFESNGGVLLSIKCLDEGFDMPSITHALIIASDQNPRQFIQRRGRVLRKDRNNPNKTKAFLYDLVISNEVNNGHAVQSLSITELRRCLEFSSHAINKHVAEMKIRDIAIAANLDINDIINTHYEDIDIEEEEEL